MKVRFSIGIILLLLLLVIIDGCTKEEIRLDAEVVITTPPANTIIHVPDTLVVNFTTAETGSDASFTVSLRNQDGIPISNQVLVESEANNSNYQAILICDALPDGETEAKAYLHIRTLWRGQENSTFQWVRLISRPPVFKGLAIGTPRADGTSTITITDTLLNTINSIITDGKITHLTAIPYSSTIVISTVLPEKITGMNSTTGSVLWEEEPFFPYPDISLMQYKAPLLFIGEGAGKVIGIHPSTGIHSIVATSPEDYYPTQLVITSDELIITNVSRNNQKEILSRHYLETGLLNRDTELDWSVSLSMSTSEENIIRFITGEVNAYQVLTYDLDASAVTLSTALPMATLDHAIAIGDNLWLTAGSSVLNMYNPVNGQLQPWFDYAGTCTHIAMDPAANKVVLLTDQQLYLIAYPSAIIISRMEIAENSTFSILTEYE